MPKKRKIKKIASKKTKETIYKTRKDWISKAIVNKSQYLKKYNESIKNNDGFWKKEGKRLNWIKPYKKIKDVKYSKDDVHIKWFYDGTLNASANCIDRHLKKNGDKTAIIWVGDDPKVQKKISYKELHKEVSKAANGLKNLGVQKGDRVTIYLTMIPELAYTMLACARIGAIHSIIFGGFSPDSISGRINDCESDYVITADEGVRGGKTIPLKSITDEALENCPNVKKCIVVKRTGTKKIDWFSDRDVWYHHMTKKVSKMTLVGPNCAGIISPGKSMLGIMPGHIYKEGRIGIISRSGTLGYEAAQQLKNLNIGVSTSVGIGGDPINGSSFRDIIEKFETDDETDAILMIGEIGGPQEVAAGEFAKENMKKPVIAYIAGLTAPKGRVMGHAGAIVSAYGESAIEKVEILKECGITISKNPSVMGDTVKSVLEKM